MCGVVQLWTREGAREESEEGEERKQESCASCCVVVQCMFIKKKVTRQLCDFEQKKITVCALHLGGSNCGCVWGMHQYKDKQVRQ